MYNMYKLEYFGEFWLFWFLKIFWPQKRSIQVKKIIYSSSERKMLSFDMHMTIFAIFDPQ